MNGTRGLHRPGRREARYYMPFVAAAGAILITVPLVLLLAGVIRFGKPSVNGVTTANRIDSRKRPVAPGSSFGQSDPRIYCCARVKAFGDTVLESRWYAGDRQVGGYSCAFSAITGSPAGRFLPAKGTVAFHLDRPDSGWTGGRYTVRLFADGRRAGEASFTVAAGESTGGSVYRDPSGLFTVQVPPGWVRSESSARGLLAGFSDVSGSYPPRFAVVSTDVRSVDPGLLNGQLGPDSGAGKFERYVLGDFSGARRDYLWDTQVGQRDVELHSIQVLIEGKDGKVYGLNCHALKSQYERYLPAFNRVINSFRLL